MLKKCLAILLVVLCINPLYAKANTSTTYWGFTNYSGQSFTSYRQKDKNGNVYCGIKYSYKDAAVDVTVGKKPNIMASKRLRIYSGKNYTIINSAGANSNVRLKFNAITVNGTYNSGTWSPDAAKDYIVIGG